MVSNVLNLELLGQSTWDEYRRKKNWVPAYLNIKMSSWATASSSIPNRISIRCSFPPAAAAVAILKLYVSAIDG